VKKLFAIFLAILLISTSWAAVAHNSNSSTTHDVSNPVTSVTDTNMTVGSGSNRALVCLIGTQGLLSVSGTLTVAWDSTGTNQAMTLLASKDASDSSGSVGLWGLLNPTSGNHTFSVTWSGSPPTEIITWCSDYTGVTGFANTTTGGAASGVPTITITTVAGDMSVDGGNVANTGPPTVTGGQTLIFSFSGASSDNPFNGWQAATGTSNTHSWSSVGTPWEETGVDLQGAPTAPSVITQSPTAVTQTSATGNGTTTSNNGAPITDEGVCIDVTPNPTSNCTSSGSTSVAPFTSSLTGLTTATKYFVNAYATNSVGTSYGNDGVSFGTLKLSGLRMSGIGGTVTMNGSGGQVTVR
jgi:hypothetical protein